METTSAELDDRIMRAARKELRPASTRWMLPLSAAAVAVFAVSIVLNLQHEDISKMLPQQQPDFAPQSVPLSEEAQPAASQNMLPSPSPAAEESSALKSAPPGVITTDQSAPVPDAAPRAAVQETGVAPPAPIPAGEEDAGQPSAYGSAPAAGEMNEMGDSERRESVPAAAMQRSASPKAADSAGSTNSSGASNTSGEATGALSAGSAEKSERDEKSPEAWIEHIRNLRIAGRDKEAQAEFEAFHDRYPDYALPADLEPGN